MRTFLFVACVGCALAVVACDKDKDKDKEKSAAAPAMSRARYRPMDGGQLRACYTEAACDGLHAGDRCYFPQPHSADQQGFCAPPEPPCVVSRPFCGVDGKTITACRFPTAPWTHEGPCADAAAR